MSYEAWYFFPLDQFSLVRMWPKLARTRLCGMSRRTPSHCNAKRVSARDRHSVRAAGARADPLPVRVQHVAEGKITHHLPPLRGNGSGVVLGSIELDGTLAGPRGLPSAYELPLDRVAARVGFRFDGTWRRKRPHRAGIPSCRPGCLPA